MSFRPLAGCELFQKLAEVKEAAECFRPLAGDELFPKIKQTNFYGRTFPSPCGV